VKPASFEYHAPSTVDEAVTVLAERGEDAKVLAGGQSLIPLLALRLTAFAHLVDVGRIGEMKGIERRDGSLCIGAGTTEADVGSNPGVESAVPLLAQATPLIGHFQIRNRGTLGGSIAHADPAAEYPAVALALDAVMETASPRGSRSIDAADFFHGLWTNSMEPDEILVRVSFPIWSGRTGFAVEEIARRHGDFAIAGATVGIELDDDDRIRRCAVALIGLGPTPERASAAEADITGRPIAEVSAEALGHLAVDGLSSIPGDLHGSPEYRKKVGAVMAARAWAAAATDAGQGGER
jgi:aerobic carbon-monoxide dehydrogenase medium subunit